MTDKDLVTLNDENVPMTTSLKVAERFGKTHGNVIRKIESLECSVSFGELNIELSSYTTEQNKKMKMYKLTRDGFSFLINKSNGMKAAEFTENFIGAFNAMEEELSRPSEPVLSALPDFTNPVEGARVLSDRYDTVLC